MIPQRGQQQRRLYNGESRTPRTGFREFHFRGMGGVDSTVGPTGDRTTESGAGMHSDGHFWSQARYRHASITGVEVIPVVLSRFIAGERGPMETRAVR